MSDTITVRMECPHCDDGQWFEFDDESSINGWCECGATFIAWCDGRATDIKHPKQDKPVNATQRQQIAQSNTRIADALERIAPALESMARSIERHTSPVLKASSDGRNIDGWWDNEVWLYDCGACGARHAVPRSHEIDQCHCGKTLAERPAPIGGYP